MFRVKYYFCAIIFMVSLWGGSVPIHASNEDSDSGDISLSPFFFVEDYSNDNNDKLDLFPLKNTDVNVKIDGVIADVIVNQTYTNNGYEPINATYIFPASTKAAVHGMKMTLGNHIVSAKKIKEKKEEASKEFEQAKTDGKSASLLEETRPNVFTMKLANIMPGDEVTIELHYSELIIPTEGIYQFVYPTVVGPRYGTPSEMNNSWIGKPYLKEGTTNPASFNLSVDLISPLPIELIHSSTHTLNEEWYNDKSINLQLSDDATDQGNKDFILDFSFAGEEIMSGLLLHEGEKENFFLLMMQPPERISLDEITPREYIFVLDISGSMNGYPLDTAKTLISDLIGKLRESDKFNVVLFAGASNKLSEKKPIEATKENRDAAIQFIEEQKGSGGTELARALNTALEIPADDYYSRSFVVITDGYIAAEKEIFTIIDDNLDQANFFAFGIGSSVNRYLIEGIGKAGLGEAFIVTNEEDAYSTAFRFREYIESPLLTDIEIAYNGLTVYDVEPRNIPTMFSERPLLIYGKWDGSLTGTIDITGQSGNTSYSQSINLDESEKSSSDALPYLWARKRVERLSDYNLDLSKNANKAEIIDIGLRYSLLTKHTSFIAVIEEIRNPNGSALDVDQPLPLPENVSEHAIAGYINMSEPHDLILLGATLLLAFTVFFTRRLKKAKVEQ